MKTDSAKYLEGINFSQLTIVEKTEIRTVGREKPELVISQSSKQNTNSFEKN
jgi:hypothetical protein